jgi:chlorobactene lauroyltransferase
MTLLGHSGVCGFDSGGRFVTMQTTNRPPLLKANHRRADEWFWGHWFERSVKKAFSKSYIAGYENVEACLPHRTGASVVMYCTHGSWWDAAVVMMLSLRVMHIRSFGMMEYKQLVRYPFFRRIGLFSVVREDPRSALESLQYAASQLQQSPNTLWMFPQGTLRHQDMRPLGFEPGLGILARSVPSAMLCPVSIRYDGVFEQRPELRIQFGTPHSPASRDVRETSLDCETRLTSLANETRASAIANSLDGWQLLHRGPLSMEKRFDAVKSVFLPRRS